MKLVRRLLLRLVIALLVTWGVASAAWFMTVWLPGDPVETVLGPQASPADVERARALYGSDRPASERYLNYHRRLVHGPNAELAHEHCTELPLGLHANLGFSFVYNQPVAALIKKKLPLSFDLAVVAIALQVLLSVGLGILAALKRGSRIDELIVGASTALSAAPTFASGLFLQYFLAHRLGLLPIDGAGKAPGMFSLSILLPALTLALYGTGVLTRLVRSELQEAIDKPFVRVARARGASRLYAFGFHALRTTLGPITQLTILELGALISGAIVTEKLFRWPGLGDLTVNAIQSRDPELVKGITLASALLVTVSTLLADLVAVLLDPRPRNHTR